MRLVCALGDQDSASGGVLTVAPCSHKSNVLPPPPVSRAEALGATLALALAPGDFVLAAATTLVAPAAGRLLELVFADTGRYPQLSAVAVTPPEWHSKLTPR